jgi:hypothetical protein
MVHYIDEQPHPTPQKRLFSDAQDERMVFAMADGFSVHQDEPIACDFRALSAAEKQRQQALFEQVHAAVDGVRELPDGYALRLPSDATTLLAVAEWVSLERRCCPFFAFALELAPHGGPLWLRITGREGVKEYVQAEMVIAG